MTSYPRGVGLALGVALSALAGSAAAATVVVPATGDIFLASQPTGSGATGFFGTDTVPDNSPVAISVSPHDELTFAASGSASVDDSCFTGPDGGCYANEAGFSPSPASNTYQGPATALIGVFLPSAVTAVSEGPASLNYAGNPGLETLASYYPALNQIFFIGDGLTGTGTGSVQAFRAPAGAATLYIAVADSYGSSTGNDGSFTVTYTDTAGPVPEPQTWSLLLVGFGAVGAMRRCGRGRHAAVSI
jgi:hypothetical protein